MAPNRRDRNAGGTGWICQLCLVEATPKENRSQSGSALFLVDSKRIARSKLERGQFEQSDLMLFVLCLLHRAKIYDCTYMLLSINRYTYTYIYIFIYIDLFRFTYLVEIILIEATLLVFLLSQCASGLLILAVLLAGHCADGHGLRFFLGKKNAGFLIKGYPQIIHFDGSFHYKASIWEYHHFRKPPNQSNSGFE